MNDCFYSWIGICEKCTNCSKYIDCNDVDGSKLLEEYTKEINEALKPIEDKWKQKFDNIQIINSIVNERIEVIDNRSCYDTYRTFFKENHIESLSHRFADGELIPIGQTYIVIAE